MRRRYPLDPVDESFFESAPHSYTYPIDLPVPPKRVWNSLQSDRSVAAWGLGVSALRWTSPRPFGVGTTREVVLPWHAVTLWERFFVWDEGRRYSFYVTEANRPLFRRFAENYVVEAAEGGSRLTWTLAIEPRAPYRLLFDAARPVNRFAFGALPRAAHNYFVKHA